MDEGQPDPLCVLLLLLIIEGSGEIVIYHLVILLINLYIEFIPILINKEEVKNKYQSCLFNPSYSDLCTQGCVTMVDIDTERKKGIQGFTLRTGPLI